MSTGNAAPQDVMHGLWWGAQQQELTNLACLIVYSGISDEGSRGGHLVMRRGIMK